MIKTNCQPRDVESVTTRNYSIKIIYKISKKMLQNMLEITILSHLVSVTQK